MRVREVAGIRRKGGCMILADTKKALSRALLMLALFASLSIIPFFAYHLEAVRVSVSKRLP